MLLTKVKVENFLSVNGKCELPVDPKVTVLLGANDHGKSNLLRALQCLNFDHPLSEEDRNWDSKSVRLDFIFKLTEQDKEALRGVGSLFQNALKSLVEAQNAEYSSEDEDEEEIEDLEEEMPTPSPARLPQNNAVASTNIRPLEQTIALAQKPTSTSAEAAAEEEEDDESVTESDLIKYIKLLENLIESSTLILTRNGIGSRLSLAEHAIEELPEELYDALRSIIPRVELFEAFSGEIQDEVTAEQIKRIEFEFLQGIFFYAGLDPLNCDGLFEQNDETTKTLEDASEILDKELRGLWGQGRDLDLHFQLRHRNEFIDLQATDPAVKKRKTRMSKRSTGVTQFFRLSMVLHARKEKNPANSYIYLFDEPGVFLHPRGQKDLLAVFEQLSGNTQILYATHSLFMLNQNFPERHRLIMRTEKTTMVDSKPYRANWRYAIDALGVNMNANILFSPNSLLVEGDSDPIYIYELLRVLNHTSTVDADANILGIMSYSDLPNLRFLIQTFKDENKERLVCVLFDGDSQGKAYQKAVAALCKTHDVRTLPLENDLVIEDYCLYPDLFIKAVEETIKTSYEATKTSVPADLAERIKTSWEEFVSRKDASAQSKPKKSTEQNAEDKIEQNTGNWFKELSKELLGEQSGGSSKVALARNYAFHARELENIKTGLDQKKLQQAKSLIEQIIKELKIPSMRAKEAIDA